MEIRATAKVKIPARTEIINTLKVYKQSLQYCIDFAWEHKIRNKIRLQYAVYKHLKTTKLQAQLIVCCCRQAIEMVRQSHTSFNRLSRKRKAKLKHPTKPISKNCCIRYNFPRSASLKDNILSISTTKGRVKVPFKIPACYTEYFSWGVPRESLLRMDKRGRCYFLFTFAKDVNSKSSYLHTDRVLGIDVGINNLAVASDGKFYGSNVKSLRIKHDKLVSKLQAKGTKSAKRHLKKLSGKWSRFMAWTNHNISKRIVESVPAGTVIIMEDLTNIRRGCRYNKWVHKWAFRQEQSFVDYKAVKKGCRVAYGNPYRTSKDCPVCHNDLVRHGGFVCCSHCGFSLSADLNGSRNLAIRYKRNFGLASVIKPIVSDDEGETSIDGLSLSSGTKAHIF